MKGPKLPQAILDHPRIDQWVAFEEERAVRVRSGRVELGQGIALALVQIAADELDVPPESIVLVAGDTRESPSEGYTSGSRSIEIGGISVRLAASAARRLLLGQAAQLLQAKPEDLTVVAGLVHVNGRPTDLTYWSLAASADLGQEVVKHARPKSVAERRLVGRALPRRDLLDKVMGGAFIHDLAPPGMLHGRVLHPPSPSARLAEFDVGEIASQPQVVRVVRDGSFIGVVAETEEAALAATARMERLATWTSGAPAPSDPVQALRDTSAEPEVVYSAGDPDGITGRRVATAVSRPYLAHASIGTSCAIAEWTGGALLVHTHSQGVFQLRGALAAVLGVPAETISVVHVPGAGCYGHNGADDVALDAALLARAVPGHSVRVAWSRADELAAAPLGPGMVTRAEAVIGADNRIAAFTLDVASQAHGQRPSAGTPANLLASRHLAKPYPQGPVNDPPFAGGGGADRNALPGYAIPHVRIVKRLIRDLPYRASSLRSLGAFINVFAIETLMDDIAHEIGVDPLALRLAHLDDSRAREVLNRAAEAAGWPGERSEGSALGLAFAQYKLRAAYCAVAVRVEIDEDIRVPHVWTAVDAGEVIDPDGVANQIEGGIVQAASWTLKEAVRFEGDAMATPDWDGYPILRFGEVPEVSVDVISRPEQPPLGVGEASMGPTAAAIGNAVQRALGVRVRDLPLTRDAIIAQLA